MSNVIGPFPSVLLPEDQYVSFVVYDPETGEIKQESTVPRDFFPMQQSIHPHHVVLEGRCPTPGACVVRDGVIVAREEEASQ